MNNERFDKIESRLDKIESRLDSIEKSIFTMENVIWPKVQAALDGVTSVIEKFMEHEGRIQALEETSESFDLRIVALESH